MISVTPETLNAVTLAAPFPRRFVVPGYQTAEDARAFFTGECTLFHEIEEWLSDNLPGARAMAAVDGFRGRILIAIPDHADEVTFMLAWGEVILK